MREYRHSVVREGLVVGIIGAVIVAVWYFVVDLAAGAPLRTPQTIGQLLLHGAAGFDRSISPAAVLVATLFHGAAFVLLGIALTALVHLASREIAWRMGVLIGLVIAIGFASGLIFAVTPATTSVRQGWRPVTTRGSPSSTGEDSRTLSVTICARLAPTTSPRCPRRWSAETAFGLA